MNDGRLPILVIDNYDSFTYNLSQMMAETGQIEPVVIRNDAWRWEQLPVHEFAGIVISPGPGNPLNAKDFGISAAAVAHAHLPLFGVCLGHQGLGHHYGMAVRHAPEPMHGRLSRIHHRGSAIFAGIPQSFDAVRYHSLVLDGALPEQLQLSAWTDDGLIMAVEARDRPLWGVQFHPESICTEHGLQMMANFAQFCRQRLASNGSVLNIATSERRKPIQADERSPQSLGKSSFSLLGKAASGRRSQPGTDRNKPVQLRLLSQRLELSLDASEVFQHLYAQTPASFFLDSSRVIDGYSRFSYLGDANGPLGRQIRYDVNRSSLSCKTAQTDWQNCGQDLFQYLEQILAQTRVDTAELPFEFSGGFVGYLGYELKAVCGAQRAHRSPNPDASLLFVDRFIAIDHQQGHTWLVHLLDENGDEMRVRQWFSEMTERLQALKHWAQPIVDHAVCDHSGRSLAASTHASAGTTRADPVHFRFRHQRPAYEALIRECQRNIRDGESYEICLTNQAFTPARPEPCKLYRILREINPAPYAALLNFDDLAVLSSSPERFLTIKANGWMEAKPIKGTIQRDADAERDEALSEQLRQSEKDRAENLMIVDLLRNDLGMVAEPGTVRVPKLMQIESYATVHQMVSTIVGRLRPECSPVQAVRAAFPGGSMTGAPKLRTMEIIDQLEGGPRGVYSGAIGYFSLNGAVDLNIVIRTIIIDPRGTHIGTGGAITWLSDPAAEYDEILLKSRAPMQAIARAVCGDAQAYVLDGQPAPCDGAESQTKPLQSVRQNTAAARSSHL